MNMFKKNGGFTLVELIVVIAILAILAGVAVPAYSGYINKAEEAADIQVLSAIHTGALAACATTGAVDKVVVTASAGSISSIKAIIDTNEIELKTGNAPEATDFATYTAGNTFELKSATYAKGATWEDEWTPNQ